VIEPRTEEIFALAQQVIRDSHFEEVLSSGVVLCGGSAQMPGMVELAEDIFLKPVRVGAPSYTGPLADMVRNPRMSTVMGLLAEALHQRQRGARLAQKSSSVKGSLGRLREWFAGNF